MPSRVGSKWTGRVMVDGRKHSKRGFPTKTAAKEWEAETRKDQRNQQSFPRLETSESLIELSVKYLIYAERFSRNTVDEKKYLCRRLLSSWGRHIPITDISTEMIQDFLDQRARFSTNASNKDRKNMLAMFNYAGRILGINHNPVTVTQARAHDVATQYTPPEIDVLKLLAVARPDEQIFLTCYLSTGARRSEIFRLKWDDVNFEGGSIRLGTRKTRDGSMKYRTLPMNSRLNETLKRWYRDRPNKESPYVFVFEKIGQPFIYRRKFLKGLCKRAGIRELGFHALRRYVASILSDKHKVSSKAIQIVLGHESQSTTERYLQKIHTGMAEVMEFLSESATNECYKKGLE